VIRKLSDAEYPLGALEAGYRRQYLPQDIRQSIVVGSLWLLPNVFVHLYGLSLIRRSAFVSNAGRNQALFINFAFPSIHVVALG